MVSFHTQRSENRRRERAKIEKDEISVNSVNRATTTRNTAKTKNVIMDQSCVNVGNKPGTFHKGVENLRVPSEGTRDSRDPVPNVKR